MPLYIVSYDLHNRRDYQPLWNALVQGNAKRILESLWLLESTHTAGTLRENLANLLDSDDSVAVIELKPGSEWSTIRAQAEGTTWLKSKIRSY
jgi:hypothetical protein